MLESEIQKQIIKYLDLKGIYYFSVPNELGGKGKAAMIRTRKLKGMGLKSGVADLVVLLPGEALFLEVKQPKKYQRPSQKEFEEIVSDLGFRYYVVRSLEDVVEVIE